jgi:tetratricopeptide (TPR) repeat protein
LPADSPQRVAFLQEQARVNAAAEDWGKSAAVYEHAIATYEQIPEIHRTNGSQFVQLVGELGRVLCNAGQWDKALDWYDKAAALKPEESARMLLEYRARAYVALNKPEAAIDSYDKAIAQLQPRDPQRLRLLQELVRIPGPGGRWDKVAEIYKKALQTDSANAIVYRLAAQSYAEQGQWDLARSTLEAAPRDALAHYYLVRILQQTGDETAYRKSLAELLSKYGPEALGPVANSLAWILVRTPDANANVSDALRWAKKAVEGNQTSPNHLNTLAGAYYRSGDYASAVKTLREAGERYVDSQRAKLLPVDKDGRADDLLLLAMAYARLGEADKAKKALAAAVHWMDTRTYWNDPDTSVWAREDRKLLRAEAEALIGPGSGN